jgi:hypothetical protein
VLLTTAVTCYALQAYQRCKAACTTEKSHGFDQNSNWYVEPKLLASWQTLCEVRQTPEVLNGL